MIDLNLFLIAVLLSLAACSMGFKNYIWFISIGYGLAVAAIGAEMMIAGGNLFASLILLIYGLRLSGYLIYREVKTAYNSRMTGEIKQNKDVPIGGRIGIWTSSGILYPLMTSGVIFRTSNHAPDDTLMYAGLGISLLGILLESAADLQKQAAKKKNPDRFVDKGLYRIVRCPNYLGELIMWTGIFISGISAYQGALQWIAAVIGYISIVYIMFSGARRLEIRQNKRYGKDAEYQKYHDSTPVLLPFVPLYSVEKYKWLVG